MTPTRIWVLVVTGVVSLLVSWLVLRSVYASLPPLPWTAAAAMVLLAIAEALSGRNLRARIRGGRRVGAALAAGRDQRGDGQRATERHSPEPRHDS